jgi:DNA-binding NarL/FixJ family response regulator
MADQDEADSGGTVIVADDHPLMRSALAQTLTRIAPGSRTTEAGSLDEALAAVSAACESGAAPHLILLDLRMPGMNGFAGLKALRARHPALPVVVVSASEDPATMRAAVDCGAAAFLPKSATPATFAEAIEEVLAGNVWLPPEALEAAGAPGAAELAARAAQLTQAQMRVLDLVARGQLNKQIAYALDISEATVKAHVSAILRKLEVTTRTQAAMLARRLGLGDDVPV